MDLLRILQAQESDARSLVVEDLKGNGHVPNSDGWRYAPRRFVRRVGPNASSNPMMLIELHRRIATRAPMPYPLRDMIILVPQL